MEEQKLPNSTLIIILAIGSYLICCFYGVGIIPAIIALVLANKAKKTYLLDPAAYSNYNTIKTGRILAIIGIILNILMIAFMVWAIIAIGWEVIMSNDQELIQERMNELFEE
ncbi:CCC motif membrane protein [Galbibacter mesophilus]|uniref:CCC motif membrane protein n=1 Tax=Galbibacter mesophilus TaxID=379069 RepID=UPI00191CA78B|nr:CCC motif membrane protein [Galbibacter mesophilus]MCM5663518.1 DUF4190 domain-containing protein [Galbibacter mesophilus]